MRRRCNHQPRRAFSTDNSLVQAMVHAVVDLAGNGIRQGRAVPKCGDHVITWQKFGASIRYLAGKIPNVTRGRLFRLIEGLAMLLCMESIYRLVEIMRWARCLDPKDKIYVAEALVSDQTNRNRPAYSQDRKSVCKEWAESRIAQGDVGTVRLKLVQTFRPGCQIRQKKIVQTYSASVSSMAALARIARYGETSTSTFVA